MLGDGEDRPLEVEKPSRAIEKRTSDIVENFGTFQKVRPWGGSGQFVCRLHGRRWNMSISLVKKSWHQNDS